MKNVAVCGVLLLACSCAAPPGVTVEHFGVMREVMMEGKTEARVALADFERPGFYGVGALAGLQGEVLIDDGAVFLARDHVGAVSGSRLAHATLLTVAHVPQWREVPLADGTDLEEIERAIAAAVPDSLRDGAAPVPFRMTGAFSALALHVARGACPHAATTPETEPARYTGHAVGTVVGFFAPGRGGVMTHLGTAIHAHAECRASTFDIDITDWMTGHVDSLVCGPGTKLFVPAR